MLTFNQNYIISSFIGLIAAFIAIHFLKFSINIFEVWNMENKFYAAIIFTCVFILNFIYAKNLKIDKLIPLKTYVMKMVKSINFAFAITYILIMFVIGTIPKPSLLTEENRLFIVVAFYVLSIFIFYIKTSKTKNNF